MTAIALAVVQACFPIAAVGDEVVPPPIIKPHVNVFAAGCRQGDHGWEAALWINGNGIKLGGDAGESQAWAMTMDGDDVYLAGYGAFGHGRQACYWKNSHLFQLDILHPHSEATGIAARNGDLYIAGFTSNGAHTMATLWRKGHPIQFLTDGTCDAEATGIALDRDGVPVVSGWESNGSHRVAKYWRLGTATPLADGTLPTRASAVTAEGPDLYFAGGTTPTVGPNRATGWKNTSGTSLSNGLNNAHAFAVDVAGGIAFRAGEDGKKAVYWRDQQQINLSDGTRKAHVTSIALLRSALDVMAGRDGDIYVGGLIDNGLRFEAVYWKNGTLVHLTDGTKASAVNSLFVRFQ